MKTIICLLLAMPLLTPAQETVKRISQSAGNKEEYYVLKSDKKIRQGPYKKVNPLNNVLMEGYYKYDLRDSTWTERWVSTALKSKGNYLMGERVGLWEFYDTEGALEQKYDFTNNELVFDRAVNQNKDKLYNVISGADTIQTVLERPPLYIGGRLKMQSAMTKGIDFPKLESGDVTVSFIIDRNGKASNHKIVNSLSKECDKASLKMAKQIPDNWIPAILNGQPVEVEYLLPISFRKLF